MLSVVAFGAVCEMPDEDRYGQVVPTVYFNSPPAPERAEPPDETAAPDPDTAQTHRGRFRGRSEGYFTTVDQAPRWQRSVEAYRQRRRRRTHAGVGFTEFADLSDGRRVIMRDDRGISWTRLYIIGNDRGSGSSRRNLPDPWHGVTRESLTDEVREYLLAEEEDCCPISPESVVEHVRRSYDLQVDAASVQAALQLPRRIEFGTRLLDELSRHEPPAGPSSGPATRG
ncbi:MAG: hypothetical protein OXE75_11390 [bacterium]|nr:hypothetical protein [bacterium]